jgi:hypothetical protein
MQLAALEQALLQTFPQGLQRAAAGQHGLAHRADRQRDSLPLIDLALPVQRQVIVELGHHDLRDQALVVQSAGDHPRRQFGRDHAQFRHLRVSVLLDLDAAHIEPPRRVGEAVTGLDADLHEAFDLAGRRRDRLHFDRQVGWHHHAQRLLAGRLDRCDQRRQRRGCTRLVDRQGGNIEQRRLQVQMVAGLRLASEQALLQDRQFQHQLLDQRRLRLDQFALSGVFGEGGFQCHQPTMPSRARAREGKMLKIRGFLKMPQATRSNRTGFSRRTDRSTPSSTRRRSASLSSPAETVANRPRSRRLYISHHP